MLTHVPIPAPRTAEKIARAKDLANGAELDEVIAKALDLYLAKHDPRERAGRREARARKTAGDAAMRGVAAPIGADECGDETTADGRVGSRSDGMPSLIPVEVRREPRRPSAALRDVVRLADGEQCTYVAADGIRCGARRNLQNDHVLPFAWGGASNDGANLRTLCRSHNLMMARRAFGGKVPR